MTAERKPFIPALPTLWPKMLLPQQNVHSFYPFNDPNIKYFYFARNAIWLAARMLKLDEGEVLAPAYHHGVEIEALIDAGAKVNFYRVGRGWDVDLEDVKRRINGRTKALYLIHYAGFPGPVTEMKALVAEHGLPLIEDCALSLLSSDKGRTLGSTGDVGIFCLYKTLPLPNGGALTFGGSGIRDQGSGIKDRLLPSADPQPLIPNIPELQSPPFTSTFSHVASSLLQNLEMRGGGAGRGVRGAIRRLGRSAVETANIERVTTGSDHFNRDHVRLGMSGLTRRILLAQNLSRIVAVRRRNYLCLLERLRDISPPLFSALPPGVCPLFYPLIVKDKHGPMERLAARGIETIDFWRYFHPACDASQFPDVVWLRDSILEIPCHQDLTLDKMEYIAGEVRAALGE